MNVTGSVLRYKIHYADLIALIRPRQWVKNSFVLLPLIFSGEFLNISAIGQALIATFLFCLASSATYIVNDIRDIEDDRNHPSKLNKRPLASGKVKVPQALLLLILLYTALSVSFFYQANVALVILLYLILNVAYTFFLKKLPVIDIFSIALGFVLRVYAGAVALTVPVSSWMLVTTLCLALYLAAIKRRQELKLIGKEGRKVLNVYTVELVDRYAELAAIGALIFYSLFVLTSRPNMVITIPFVLYGLFRYWYLIEVQDGCESPTDALLSDRQLLATVCVWGSTCLWALWPVAT